MRFAAELAAGSSFAVRATDYAKGRVDVLNSNPPSIDDGPDLIRPQLLRARLRAALRPRVVLVLASFPPMARLLSRLPEAPTCDLPSRSC